MNEFFTNNMHIRKPDLVSQESLKSERERLGGRHIYEIYLAYIGMYTVDY